MTERWRLVNGTELYDIVDDPAQAQDIAEQNPEEVATLRARYEAWWQSLEPVFDDYVRIGVPMTILMWILATFLIPVFWPFV